MTITMGYILPLHVPAVTCDFFHNKYSHKTTGDYSDLRFYLNQLFLLTFGCNMSFAKFSYSMERFHLTLHTLQYVIKIL